LVNPHCNTISHPVNIPPQLGYGLGTAMYKRGKTDEIDESIINNTLTAIKNGYYHLDGAEGMSPLLHIVVKQPNNPN
jgi:diketogulonate reductase-like aldo/keto reductase